MSDLDAIVEQALAAVDGYEQAEAYGSESLIRTVYVDGTRISNVETKRESGLMIRMADSGRQGKSSVTLGAPNAVKECARMAETVLRHSPEGPPIRFADPGPARIVAPDVWDRRVEEATPDDLRELARRLIDSCDADIPRAQIRVSTVRSRVMNSNGVDASHESTLVYGHFTSMFRGDQPGEGVETFHGTHLDIPVESIGASLSRQARDSASARGFEGHEAMTMILPPSQLGDMLMSSVGAAVNGENVRYNRSLWKDSVGEQVASEELTMVDDPTVPAPLACAVDDEGTPTDRRTVIEGGVLRSFLRDSLCGDSTGNGMRRSSVEPMGAFERTPTVKPLNLTVGAGNMSRDDIVAQTDRGILVERFANPEADELSGSFGLNVRCGYLIRNGEVVGVVNNSLLMGNMFEALRSIEAIGSDVTQTGVVSVPTMSFSGSELVGD